MIGTFINVGTVLVGSLIGLLIKKGIPAHIEKAVMQILGLAVAIIGLNGMLGSMFTVDLTTGKLVESGTLVLLISLVAGALVGELLKLDDGLNRFGLFIERRTGAEGFAKGFIAASLMFCIGAMSIVGAFNEGISGDSSILILKSALDFVTAIVLSSTLGVGVAFAAVAVLLYQGGLTLAAGFLAPILAGELLNMICMVGYGIVICIGLNLLADTKIKTANLLPALLGPVVYNLLMLLKTL